MLLVDSEIQAHCMSPVYWFDGKPLISPFSEGQLVGVVSFGVTSAGYDLRMDRYVKVFKDSFGEIVDPKRFHEPEYVRRMFDEYESDTYIVLPGHGYALVQSVECMSLPHWLKGRCVGKSTYARCGVIVNTTPLEPEWKGTLTIEVSNANPCPVRLYVGEGIAQLEFERLALRPRLTYADKKGKYQDQTQPTPPRMKQ